MGESIEQLYLEELVKDEVALTEADRVYKEAIARFEIAGRRYAATRDSVTEHYGESPYANNFSGWPQALDQGIELGKYRFLFMSVGDAIKSVLREADQPLPLPEITISLYEGRARANARMVNAALMRTGGVQKDDNDLYSYNQEADVQDLPF